jgi:hypothetical protein
MANELSKAQKWIYDTLVNDAETTALIGQRVYHGQARAGTLYPLIVFSHQGGPDTQGVCTVRIQANPIFQIKVICDGNPNQQARDVADRIDELFQTAVTQISDGYVFSSRRIQPIDYIESKPNGGGHYTHVGGLFRLLIYPEAS